MIHPPKSATLRLLFRMGIGFLLAGCGPEPEAPAARDAAAPAIRFEPAGREYRDVGVGETIRETIAVIAPAPVNWSEFDLVASCDCLAGEFLVRSFTPTRAEVVLSVIGLEVEDVDGELYLEGPGKERLATFRAPIVAARIPFVQPREVFVARGPEGRFEIVVGQAFPHGAKRPGEILDDIGEFDESKLALLDMTAPELERTDEDVVVRTRLEFSVVDDALEERFEAAVQLSFGEPPVRRTVLVHWPGQ